MKIVQSSDYRIYFDDVRMDEYIKNWTAACGLRASDAVANITMYRSKELETWKGYLTQVRIFARNVFSGKFSIVFEGEIMNRNWGEGRNDTGEITFMCKGFYHWLDIPIPLMIGQEESFDEISRFRYAAQNIDVEGVEKLFALKEEVVMKDESIQEVIDALFEVMNSGYYLNEDSSFHWAKLQDRFHVMAEVIQEFRQAGFLDTFTFVRATQIESFYVYLTQVLTQLMFEFYQDRDGAFRIKNPSWKEPILKTHILDESIVQSANGFNDWENEPSRVLVIGGKTDLARTGGPLLGINPTQTVPMGLYVGLPGEGEYFAHNVEVMMEQFGMSNPDGFTGGSGAFFDDITGNYPITSGFGPRNGAQHNGTDYGMRYAPLNSLGVQGEVTLAKMGNATAGNWVIVTQNIDGQRYDFAYLHLSEISVAQGDKVSPGQKLGITGNTGDSDGPHLHLEIWKGERKAKGSTALNPAAFLDEMKKKSSLGGTVTAGDPALVGDTTQTTIMNQDLKNQSNWNATQLNNWINKKAKTNSLMYNKGGIFERAARESGLDPLYLVAHAAHETDWGTSNIARMKFNFYGIAAFDASPMSSAYNWSGADAGIVEGAKWIKKNYYDKGQNTLWKMRYSDSGKHNYATDQQWPHKIANVWKAAGAPTGSAGGAPAATTGGSTISTKYLGTPYAFTGGFSFTTKVSEKTLNPLNPTLVRETNTGIERNAEKAKVVTYDFSTDILKYKIPFSAQSYASFITKRPNGMNANLLCCVIQTVSGWKEKAVKDGVLHGLMGIHQNYITQVLGGDKKTVYDPTTNIQHGTLMFKQGYDRFTKKVTFGLASLFTGNLAEVESWIEKAGKEDFSVVRNVVPANYKYVVSLVDAAIEAFVKLFNGDYIKGDPHRTFILENANGSSGIETGLAESTDVKDYESSYKPVMSDEERLYKVNLKVSEQLLIRYDTPGVGESTTDGEAGTTPMNADEIIERYAKYMMQLYRAESHGVNVMCSTCMPFLRPGWNAWLEPTRRDLVFYITRVSHQGSFGNGSFTTVTGAFVRDPSSYDDIEDNIFVSEKKITVDNFGEVVDKSGMGTIKQELAGIHTSDEVITDARYAPVISQMYSSASSPESENTTMWNSEYSSDEIQSKLTTLYAEAPQVVIDRKSNLTSIVSQSSEFFTKMLLNTKF